MLSEADLVAKRAALRWLEQQLVRAHASKMHHPE